MDVWQSSLLVTAATAGSEEASIFKACTIVWRWFSVHRSVKPRLGSKDVVFSNSVREGADQADSLGKL